MTTRTITGLVAGALLLLAGCSGESEGQAEPAPGPSSPANSQAPTSDEQTTPPSSNSSDTTTDLPHSGAPAVTNPLPKSVVSGDPCKGLTPDQIRAALGKVVQGEPDRAAAGPSCYWSNPEQSSGFLLGYDTGTGQGLSAQYKNTRPTVDMFEAIKPIGGYPAVRYQASTDSRDCTVAVGIANEYAISVVASSDKDPCAGAARLTEDVISNLKAKA
ncbi:DUF3558 domain-containing protein [Prauserella halophila]|uniref:DUF3558 domain-containing protein n=1 Tax=Prauserella halophila TaxID=185641 RepID=A0ABN1W7S9_9PSEU|nr:DUF3558 domain-containing protein [Prauserella halophila]MCP2235850.1 Protein of unknown function (DUF3558) [Prauserella halophila]